jgi:hypothetical protein
MKALFKIYLELEEELTSRINGAKYQIYLLENKSPPNVAIDPDTLIKICKFESSVNAYQISLQILREKMLEHIPE